MGRSNRSLQVLEAFEGSFCRDLEAENPQKATPLPMIWLCGAKTKDKIDVFVPLFFVEGHVNPSTFN